MKNDKNFPPSPSYPPYHQRPIAHRKEQKPLLTIGLWSLVQKAFFRIKADDKNLLTYGFLKELRSVPTLRQQREVGKFFLFFFKVWSLKNKKNFLSIAFYPPYHRRPIAHRNEQKTLIALGSGRRYNILKY